MRNSYLKYNKQVNYKKNNNCYQYLGFRKVFFHFQFS